MDLNEELSELLKEKFTVMNFQPKIFLALKCDDVVECKKTLERSLPGFLEQERWTQAYHNYAESGSLRVGWNFITYLNTIYYIRSRYEFLKNNFPHPLIEKIVQELEIETRGIQLMGEVTHMNFFEASI